MNPPLIQQSPRNPPPGPAPRSLLLPLSFPFCPFPRLKLDLRSFQSALCNLKFAICNSLSPCSPPHPRCAFLFPLHSRDLRLLPFSPFRPFAFSPVFLFCPFPLLPFPFPFFPCAFRLPFVIFALCSLLYAFFKREVPCVPTAVNTMKCARSKSPGDF